ncbi:hypothetical protein EDD15DRAFT_404132 [Pisolithus albus]|nr:hypothetical protein EDD15DRAFT_404132 [Pisolithus albus]
MTWLRVLWTPTIAVLLNICLCPPSSQRSLGYNVHGVVICWRRYCLVGGHDGHEYVCPIPRSGVHLDEPFERSTFPRMRSSGLRTVPGEGGTLWRPNNMTYTGTPDPVRICSSP